MKVAVVAHSGKTLGEGLLGLRRSLAAAGIDEPLWSEVPKSRYAPPKVREALDQGADLVFAWGGDGMVRRCAGEIAGSAAALAIVPAGTANLLASSLGIPQDIDEAVAIGLRGDHRRLDVGRFNNERFVAMAGAGFDAAMLRDADDLKDRFGRGGYVWGGMRNLRADSFDAQIKVDGASWYSGRASCILIGNIGQLFGGLTAFEDASPVDGKLELGVVTADGPVQWARIIARAATGRASRSPLVRTTRGQSIRMKLDRKVRYELDGGDRSKAKSFKVEIEPGALTVCVPARGAAA